MTELRYSDGTIVTCPVCGSTNMEPLWSSDNGALLLGGSGAPTDAICEDCETLI